MFYVMNLFNRFLPTDTVETKSQKRGETAMKFCGDGNTNKCSCRHCDYLKVLEKKVWAKKNNLKLGTEWMELRTTYTRIMDLKIT